ncbi:hypothetical protein [Aquimarina sp. MAR_2010_214]|nr:hypothetical protein [Aquimarina sp. MAR_2010_214]
MKLITINSSTEVLKNTDLPTSKIAMKIGLDDQQYCSAVFKEIK